MKKKIIGIVGANGVPPSYGGWDQLVEHFTKLEHEKFEFIIYCTYLTNSCNNSKYNNAKVRVVNLNANGWQSIPFDIISLYKAWRECDSCIMLGTSGAIAIPFFRLLGLNIILNIDGAEWKRGKWGYLVKKFLKLSEFIGVKFSNFIVSDNDVISEYVSNYYNVIPQTIAYGADHVCSVGAGKKLLELNLNPRSYAFKVCRIVPENNIDIILKCFSLRNEVFVLVGNFESSDYGKYIKNKYDIYKNIFLMDPIYDSFELGELRSNAGIYIHGHSVGGTNPSLIEAMYLGLNIVSFDVNYNRVTTMGKAHFFSDVNDLNFLLESWSNSELYDFGYEAKEISQEKYTWHSIMNDYTDLLNKL
jgi:hypothetical protein